MSTQHPFYAVAEIFWSQPYVVKVLDARTSVQEVVDAYRLRMDSAPIERATCLRIYGVSRRHRPGQLLNREFAGNTRCRELEKEAVEDKIREMSLSALESGIERGQVGTGCSLLTSKVNEIRDHWMELQKKTIDFDRFSYWNLLDVYEQLVSLRHTADQALLVVEQMQTNRLQSFSQVEQPALFNTEEVQDGNEAGTV